MSDYRNILGGGDGGKRSLTQEQLLAYMEGNLPEAERRAVEEALTEDGMESDAHEGLQALSIEETTSLKNRLHSDLQKKLGKKHRLRRGISEQRWTWIAIVVILLLTVLCYTVMHLAKQPVK